MEVVGEVRSLGVGARQAAKEIDSELLEGSEVEIVTTAVA